MSIAELRVQLHQAIDSLTDKAKMEAIYELLKDSKGNLKRMTREEYVKAINEAQEDIRQGRFMSQSDLEKASRNW